MIKASFAIGLAVFATQLASAQTVGTSAWTRAGTSDNGFYESSPRYHDDGTRTIVANARSSAQSSFSQTPINAAASAYSDMSTGKMGVYGSSNDARLGGEPAATRSESAITDRLTFLVQGANADQITPITVSYGLDGSFSGRFDSGTGAIRSTLFLNNAGLYIQNDTTRAGPTGFQPGASNWQSYSTTLTQNGMLFTGVFNLRGASTIVDFSSTLRSTTYADSTVDFSHTSTVRFTLPSTVTFTSASNNFLTAAGAVPEPASWAMMIGGLGLVGEIKRRATRRIQHA
ncbi:PEPxxWA-CTERM sorting domain-containing protein [Sphingomonas antarctica]|uniref:PEPxxWA-CTERM sorting domain-containing protein n=1 Tax=Sphingomonas antarctica TaxID=2040274 RepID=UPI0039EBA158